MKWHVLAFALSACFLATQQQSSADIVNFIATGAAGEGLLEGNISPSTGEPGTGGIGPTGISFNTDSEVLHIDLKWGSANGYVDLSADVFKLHMHGPTPSSGAAAFGETAPLLVTLSTSSSFNASRTSGGLNANFVIDQANIQDLLDGRMYINVHISDTDTGVIRGYLQAVPEPGSLMLLGVFAGLTAFRRRRVRR